MGPVLAAIFGLLFSEGLIGGVGHAIDSLTGIDVGLGIFSALGAILLLWLFKLWFRPEYKGSFAAINTKDRAMIGFIAAGILVDLLYIAYGWLTSSVTVPSGYLMSQALMAGVCEEIAFRALPIAVAMQWHSVKKYFHPVTKKQ